MYLRKVLRIVVLTFLILLAAIGIGISGAIPLFGSNKKDEFIEVKTEQLDEVDNDDKHESELEIIP